MYTCSPLNKKCEVYIYKNCKYRFIIPVWVIQSSCSCLTFRLFLVVLAIIFVSQLTHITVFPIRSKHHLCIKLPDKLSSCHQPSWFGLFFCHNNLIFQIISSVLQTKIIFIARFTQFLRNRPLLQN